MWGVCVWCGYGVATFLQSLCCSLVFLQLFSIIVFGCVSDQADLGGDCQGYSFSDACSFAVAVGVIAFLICLVLLIKDIVLIIVDFSEAIKVSLVVEGEAIYCASHVYNGIYICIQTLRIPVLLCNPGTCQKLLFSVVG